MKLRTTRHHNIISPDEYISNVDPEGFKVVYINEAIGMLLTASSAYVTVYMVDIYNIYNNSMDAVLKIDTVFLIC